MLTVRTAAPGTLANAAVTAFTQCPQDIPEMSKVIGFVVLIEFMDALSRMASVDVVVLGPTETIPPWGIGISLSYALATFGVRRKTRLTGSRRPPQEARSRKRAELGSPVGRRVQIGVLVSRRLYTASGSATTPKARTTCLMTRRPTIQSDHARAALSAGSDPGAAIPALLEKHGRQVHGLAMRLCRHGADADDMVQDVFLQAFRKWHTFKGHSDPGTWLYAIAARSCSDRHRRRGGIDKRMPAMSQLMPWRETSVMAIAAAPERDENPAERAEAIARVQAEIARLPEHLRVPLVMKEVLGVSVQDVGSTLGLAENTIKTRLHRARLTLRKAMTARAPAMSAPAPIYDKQICLDLLKAKMAAMDRGGTAQGFKVPQAEVCARCRAVFRELDIVQDACMQMSAGELPARVRAAILAAIKERDAAERTAAPGVRRGRRPVRLSNNKPPHRPGRRD